MKDTKPGDGIKSLKTSNIFRIVNFELYARQVSTCNLLVNFMSYI